MATTTPTSSTPGIDVISQPGPAKPLTYEERKHLLANVRHNMGRSRLAVKGSSDMHPYWARSTDMEEMSRLESLGFRVVVDDHKKPRYKASGLRQDGTYIVGDVIHMEVPNEVYDILEQENLKTARNLVASAKDTFKDEAERQGVPVFEVKPKVKEVK